MRGISSPRIWADKGAYFWLAARWLIACIRSHLTRSFPTACISTYTPRLERSLRGLGGTTYVTFGA